MKSIKALWCYDKVARSAKRILKQQRDMGNDNLQVLVKTRNHFDINDDDDDNHDDYDEEEESTRRR